MGGSPFYQSGSIGLRRGTDGVFGQDRSAGRSVSGHFICPLISLLPTTPTLYRNRQLPKDCWTDVLSCFAENTLLGYKLYQFS